MLEAAKQFSRKPMSEMERLTEIQHYGGKTLTSLISQRIILSLYSWRVTAPQRKTVDLSSKKND